MNHVQSFDALPSKLPMAAKLAFGFLIRLKSEHVQIITPERTTLTFGDPQQSLSAVIKINDWRACGRVFRAGDIGFAECIENGWLEVSDITALLRLAIRNENALNRLVYGGKLATLWYRLRHLLRRNTRQGSRRNIHAHYDIGNDFYRLWLDNSLTYSSALFEGDYSLSLQSAQERKYQRIIHQLGLKTGDHLLEIGCGWGGFAEFAGKLGLKVTGITLSESQLAVAKEKIKRSGLQHCVNFYLRDYRDSDDLNVAGSHGQLSDQPSFQYDGIVSIEMFEAVGERYWPSYFQTIAKRLKAGGKALVQSITIDERHFERYRSGTDFIQQYIFPGGMLPSKERFCTHASSVGLKIQQQFAFGSDYVETLRRWRQAWEREYESILKQGFDERFMRIWRLYFAYCEAGFAEKKTDVVQFLLHKPAGAIKEVMRV